MNGATSVPTPVVGVDSATPTAVPVPPAPVQRKKFDSTGESYNSLEEFKSAWLGTQAYSKLEHSQRVASLKTINNRWALVDAERRQSAGAQQADQPDSFGRLNQLAGQTPDPIMRAVTQALIPPSNTQAAIDLALFTAGGPVGNLLGKGVSMLPEAAQLLAKPVARLAFPAAMGALGGGQQGGGRGAVWGALSGAGQQAVGELASTTLGVARRAMQRADVRGFGKWLDSLLTDNPRKPTYKNLSDIVRDFNGGESDKVLYNQLAKVQNRVFTKTPIPLQLDPEVVSYLQRSNPTLYANIDFTKPIPFDEATKVLEDVEDIGWDWRFRMRDGRRAQMARSAVHQAEDTIAEAIDQVNPKLATEWGTARHKYRVSRAMSNLFREPGVIKNGQLNVQRVQELLADAGPNGFGAGGRANCREGY
jgi:hypothetical protein